MNKKDQEYIVNKIRTQYTEKEMTGQEEGLKKLQELDKEVRRPANVFAYTFGTVAALIMGTGMSLVMTEIGNRFGEQVAMPAGVTVGVIGLLMAVANYPIYKKILAKRQ